MILAARKKISTGSTGTRKHRRDLPFFDPVSPVEILPFFESGIPQRT
jgi:hypothetical protein